MGTIRRILSHRLARGAAIPAAALLAAAGAASAPAQAAGQFGGAANLTAVSCPSASWCMAVGSYTTKANGRHALAQAWNGRTWRVLKPPGQSLTGVSCTATWFCLATGGPSGAERWNGTTWHEIAGPQGAVTAPSCGSRSWCVTINGSIKHPAETFAETWNGHRWRTWWEDTNVCSFNSQNFTVGQPCALTGIACGNAANCVAAGYYSAYPGVDTSPTPVPQGYLWNGKHWAPTAPGVLGPQAYGPGSEPGAVACAGAFCLVLSAETVMWNAATATWTNAGDIYGCTPGTNCGFEYAMSCGSATSCMVFSYYSGNRYWDGSTWRSAPSVGEGRGSLLGAVSCGAGPHSQAACLAVGHQTHHGVVRTLAELWNGATWKVLVTPNLT